MAQDEVKQNGVKPCAKSAEEISKVDGKLLEIKITGDITSYSDLSSSSSLKNLVLIAPDGGWGWVVVLASFVCQAIIEGLLCVFGFLLPYLLDYYGAGRGRTAMASSLMAGMLLMSGPIAGGIVNVYGCRVCTIIGSLTTAAGLGLSTIAPSINLFILLYGVVVGIGLGLQLVPSIVIVGYYFERKRALATGLACSGAGAGMLVFAIFTQFLLEHFHWHETLLILAALSLNGVVMGCLMRPLERPKIPSDTSDSKPEVNQKLISNSQIVPVITTDDSQLEAQIVTKRPPWFAVQNASLRLELNEVKSASCYTSCHELSDGNGTTKHSKNRSVSECNKDEPLLCHSHGKDLIKSCHELNRNPVPKYSRRKSRSMIMKDLENPLNRKDIFYSGSIINLPEYQSQADSRSYIASTTKLPSNTMDNEEIQSSACSLSFCVRKVIKVSQKSLRSMFDMEVLKNPYFIMLALANVFIQMAYFIPYVFIIDYALQIDIPPDYAASLISVLGVSNGIGRAAAGSLGNIRCLNPLHVNNVSLIVAGISLILIGLVCKSYIPMISIVAVFGYAVAAFVSLLTVFLVKYLGLDQLTSSLSLLNLFKGLASFVGPPLAGIILDNSSSYKLVFCIAGSFFIIAAILYYMLLVASKSSCLKKETQK